MEFRDFGIEVTDFEPLSASVIMKMDRKWGGRKEFVNEEDDVFISDNTSHLARLSYTHTKFFRTSANFELILSHIEPH